MDYQLLWLYMRRFRQEIPDVIDQIVEVYKAFRPQYMKMETNGIGLGAAQVAQMRGVPIVANPKAKDKIENAVNAIYRVKSGRVWFPEQAPWLEDALNEVFTWTGDPAMTDDIVDTLSDACNDVTWDAQGQDPVFQTESIMPNCNPQFHRVPLGYSFPGSNLPY
jgi:predicted phage terminase large subunit-like protein